MSIDIRPATPADLPALTALFREMEVHYGGPAAAPMETEIRAALERHVFAPEARVALMVAAARLAVARGCSRINWNAARENAAALAFYAGLGARSWDNVVSLRID